MKLLSSALLATSVQSFTSPSFLSQGAGSLSNDFSTQGNGAQTVMKMSQIYGAPDPDEGNPEISRLSNLSNDIEEDEECSIFDYNEELHLVSDLPESTFRQARRNRERANRARFFSGERLIELRENAANMRGQLEQAKVENHEVRISALTDAIASLERRDPDLVYARALKECSQAELDGRMDDANLHWQEAKGARDNIDQLNLHGLWVGKYGSSGYQMINITYVGDTIIATKVTGDKNVPKGEVTFQANLSPSSEPGSYKRLEPIVLSEAAAKKWGTSKLHRFTGKGQVAAEGFKDREWMDGQLIMVGDYFSFAWIPIGIQIFFGRPSLELTLKMLKEDKYKMDGADAMRAHISRCFDWDGVDEPNDDQDDDTLGVFQ